MLKIKRALSFINDLTGGFIALFIFGILLPVSFLMGMGVYAIYQQGYLLPLLILFLIFSMFALLPRLFYLRKQKRQRALIAPISYVGPAADWSENEALIWEQLGVSITNRLQKNSEWAELKNHSMELALEVANYYGKKELDFTVPEGLQLLEEVSRQYRKVLDDIVPGIDVFTVSQVKSAYDFQSKHAGTIQRLYQLGKTIWRTSRFINPTTALVSEIRGKILASLTDQAAANLQYNAKQAFLQEVVKVCINLYSGRFIVDESKVKASKINQKDNARIVAPLEPVRVAIVGQVSAGKSSVINALLNDMQAETDPLPTTNKTCIYPCVVEDKEILRFADTQGLDGSAETLKNAFHEILESDLVLWVLKANQSARVLDLELQEKLQEFYADNKNLSKKRPKIIAVLNQVDQLRPVDEWAPPDDFVDGSEKMKIINEAIAFNQSILTIANVIYPLGLPVDKAFYGVKALEAEIQRQYEYAINVQLNRRNNEAKGAKGLLGQARSLFNGGKQVLKGALPS